MNRKNKKFKGTVLFTVVSVMSILLIFLLGTLVLAASANKRNHRTYASTQAEFAARSAIESFFTAMENNDAIAADVETLSVGSPMYVEVNLNSNAFGRLATIDGHSSSIKVEAVQDQGNENFVLDGTNGWKHYPPVKITAVAQLGKEQGSVVAYIRKKAPDEVHPVPIKGLQLANIVDMKTCDATYTGGFGFNICGDDPENANLDITNNPKFETDLTYINGNAHFKTQAEIHAFEPATGTVIMGNLDKENNAANCPLVSVKYDKSKINSMNDVPYLFVEGTISSVNGITIKSFDDAPYNVFCGSFTDGSNPSSIDADIYMMDQNATSTFGIASGSGSILHKWVDSVSTKTNQSFSSEGGNIYSRGYLILNGCQINGGVYVERDLTLNQTNSVKVDVSGSIVCGGTVTLTDEFIKSNSPKTIYCKEAKIGADTVYSGGADLTYTSASDPTKYVTFKDVEDYKNAGNQIYPSLMEKAVITGVIPDSASGENNKIIPNLQEVRQQLNYIVDPVTGLSVFDPTVYLTSVPSSFDCSKVYNSNSNYNNPITDSCTIQGDFGSQCNIKIDPPEGSEIWIVLKDANFINGMTLDVNDANRKINFLVDGTFRVKTGNGVYMTTSNIKPNAVVAESTEINVTWYGTVGSKMIFDNGGTIVGTAKAPYTSLSSTSSGAYAVSYGGQSINSPWIGNAFLNTIEKVEGRENNLFKVLCSGNPDGDDSDLHTQDNGDYRILYFNEY